MILRANANFRFQEQSLLDPTRTRLGPEQTDYLVQNSPPPPDLVNLRIASIKLSIKIILLQRKLVKMI